ncbi:unnamed protein product [Bursaphelenchus xylophilus]|uniref:(pine wood nematode) hypothetical protein n=1 Tax=Bursaphelenchus xylophilus TaxID=6326 RepID=A0A7I8XPJ0_BURXY|nr:unnamed protein product [Bursaphelenchus xylophilus]CAG9086974.1 unnamed protein product [Bursaphelenchus xylophilus]
MKKLGLDHYFWNLRNEWQFTLFDQAASRIRLQIDMEMKKVHGQSEAVIIKYIFDHQGRLFAPHLEAPSRFTANLFLEIYEMNYPRSDQAASRTRYFGKTWNSRKFWSTRSNQYKMHFRSPRPVISPHLEGFTAKCMKKT